MARGHLGAEAGNYNPLTPAGDLRPPVPPAPASVPGHRAMSERIYYDGGCGVCHWAVAFVSRRDRRGRFRFAPLGGETLARRLSPEEAAALPDSLVVESAEGELLLRSRGMIYVLRRLGGPWALLGRLLAWVPSSLRDRAYDAFARRRHRLASRPEGACPLLPPELARRFDP